MDVVKNIRAPEIPVMTPQIWGQKKASNVAGGGIYYKLRSGPIVKEVFAHYSVRATYNFG